MKKLIYLSLFFAVLAGLGYPQTAGTRECLTGPKLLLGYQTEAPYTNSVDCFMYFVPLTSPTSLTISTDPDAALSASITSWKTQQRGNEIHVQCDFDVMGDGTYCASYNSDEMIRKRLTGDAKTKEITRLLEWIRIEGPCRGRIEGTGQLVNNTVQMENITVSFNRDNTKSPVQISIYDISKVKGKFLYENRKNCQVARINSLKFKRNEDGSPRMTVEIDSLAKEDGKEGMFSRLTAMIANALSTSTSIRPEGNSTMMDFGTALYNKQSEFVFPYAENIKTNQFSKL